MKKQCINFFTVFLVVLNLSVCPELSAHDNQKNLDSLKSTLPSDLMFDGKPIDPRIICKLGFGDSTRFEPINIKNWLNMTTQSILTNPDESEKGFFGGDIQDPIEGSSYCKWKYIGTMDNDHIIEVHERGMTSSVSTIFLMARNGDTVQNVGDFTGGYKSHWGIADAFVKGTCNKNKNILYVEQVITQREMFLECLEILAENKSNDLQLNKNKDYAILESVKYRGKIIPVSELHSCNAEWAGKILTAWENIESHQVIGFELYENYCLETSYLFVTNPDRLNEAFTVNPQRDDYPLLQQCFDKTYKSYLKNRESLDETRGISGNTRFLFKGAMAQFAKDVLDLYLSFKPAPVEKLEPEAITKNLLPGISSFAYLNFVKLAQEQKNQNN